MKSEKLGNRPDKRKIAKRTIIKTGDLNCCTFEAFLKSLGIYFVIFTALIAIEEHFVRPPDIDFATVEQDEKTVLMTFVVHCCDK